MTEEDFRENSDVLCGINTHESTSKTDENSCTIVKRVTTNESMVFTAPIEKRMRIEADGLTNKVTITFE